MTREIKFRARYFLEIKPVRALKWTDGVLSDVIFEDGTRIEFQETDLIQFTGLLDKSGKEIYESDILELSLHIASDKKDKCEVIFKDGGFKAKSAENEVGLSNFYTKNGKIIEK